MRQIISILILISLLPLLGFGCQKDSAVARGENLAIELEYWTDDELKVRDSWIFNFKNTGEDLHSCSIALDHDHSTKLSNILIRTGFLGLWKEKLGDNTFYKNMELEIMDTSDFDQNKIFVNQNDESYPRMNIPKQVSVSCDEGEETWEL